MTQTFLTRDQILAAQDLKREVVDVPEWGGQVTVVELCEADIEQFMKGSRTKISLAALCVVDADGKRIFSEDDESLLARKNSRALRRLFEVCMRVNALGDQEGADLEKKSETGLDAGSTSD